MRWAGAVGVRDGITPVLRVEDSEAVTGLPGVLDAGL